METVENLIVEITTACNLKCVHCGYKKINPYSSIDTSHVVSIIEKLTKYGLQTVMLTGGEPTLNKDILFIARFCKQNKLRVKVASNGAFLLPLDALLKEGVLDELVISIDAVNPQTYLRIRGRDILDNIYQFIEQNPRYANHIHLSFLIQKYNYTELMPFLVKSKMLNVAKVSLLVPHFDSDFTSLMDLKEYRDTLYLSDTDVSVFQQSIAPALKEFYANNPQLFTCSISHIEALISYICAPAYHHNFRSSVCSFPLRSLFLYSDGRITLCPYSNWFIDLDSFLGDMKRMRMTCILKGKEREIYCKRCLEVPL